MIVKNEEATLGHCLESVRPIVDEMVIVDTGSTDKTIEIARSFGARVYHFDWCDDFSAARNESLKYCTGEWILVMDADEAIDPLDYDKIRDACLRPRADAYFIMTRDYKTDGNTTSMDSGVTPNTSHYSEGRGLPYFYDNPVLRLSRRFEGLAYSYRVHENPMESLEQHGKTHEALEVVIHHYGYLRKRKNKTNYYFELAKQEVEKNPSSEQAMVSLLQQALSAEKWDIALATAQRRIKSSLDSLDSLEIFTLYALGRALYGLKRYREAIDAFEILLSFKPDHLLGLAYKGATYIELGRKGAGRKLLKEATDLEPNFVRGHILLARLEYEVNNIDSARKVLLDTIKTLSNEPSLYELLVDIELADDNHKAAAEAAKNGLRNCLGGDKDKWRQIVIPYYRQMAEMEIANNNFDAGRKIVLEVLEVVPDEACFYDLLLRVEMAAGNHQQAARYAIQGMENCPGGGDGLWHRLAAVYLLQSGERQTAKSVIELGLKTFPNDVDMQRLSGMV
jgi:glycosyltransferase involved in cell wall biosynthesis